MRSHVEVEGSSIDEAIKSGLAMLGVTRERAEVEILRDARRSLLGFGGQKARVRMTLRDELRLEEVSSSNDERREDSVPAGGAATILSELLNRMGFEARVDAASDEARGQMLLRIASDSSGLLIGRHGQTLDALEYLVNRILSRHEEREHRIVVDCENYRERRARELQETARQLAENVRQSGRPQAMVPMTPRDRRTVHMALSNDAGVVTQSMGQGYFRHVVIAPARDKI